MDQPADFARACLQGERVTLEQGLPKQVSVLPGYLRLGGLPGLIHWEIVAACL